MASSSGIEQTPLLGSNVVGQNLAKYEFRRKIVALLLSTGFLAVSFRVLGFSSVQEDTSHLLKDIRMEKSLRDVELVPDTGNPWTKVIITQDQMINNRGMRQYYESLGLTKYEFINKKYLPKEIVVHYSRRMIEGEVGTDAFDYGQVGFAMTHKNKHGNANRIYNIVLYLNGTLVSFSPMEYYYDSIYPGSFKFYEAEPTYVILGTKAGDKWHGPVVLWNWDGTEHATYKNLTTLGISIDAHDVSSCRTNLLPSDCTIWGIDKGVAAYDRTGKTGTCANYTTTSTSGDLNHGQVIGVNATMAVVSDRGDSSVIVMQLPGSADEPLEVLYIIGGDNGNVTLIDEHGIRYERGSSLWVGQHNAEYFGNDEFYMYDNHATNKNDSRALIVKLDRENDTATIVWSYDMGFYNPVYGDVDRVANGHIQVCGWLYAERVPYDMVIREIVPDTQISAWDLKVINQDADEKRTDKSAGWNVYSSERHYEMPLMWNITCMEMDGNSELFFFALNKFKLSYAQSGNVLVYDRVGRKVFEDRFEFLPYFMPSPVNVTVVSRHVCRGGVVTIKNQWGDVMTKPL